MGAHRGLACGAGAVLRAGARDARRRRDAVRIGGGGRRARGRAPARRRATRFGAPSWRRVRLRRAAAFAAAAAWSAAATARRTRSTATISGSPRRAAPTCTPSARRELLRRVDGGWEVETQRPGAWLRQAARGLPRGAGRARSGRARDAASSCCAPASVARTSAMLVRSNSETVVGAGARDTSIDYSDGIAIGSSFRPNARHAHRARALLEGLEHDGPARHRARRRRRQRPAPAALARRRLAPSAAFVRSALGAALVGAHGDAARDAGARTPCGSAGRGAAATERDVDARRRRRGSRRRTRPRASPRDVIGGIPGSSSTRCCSTAR